jgi:hypothetical protein
LANDKLSKVKAIRSRVYRVFALFSRGPATRKAKYSTSEFHQMPTPSRFG